MAKMRPSTVTPNSLSRAIRRAKGGSRFCCDGTLPNVDPGLEVEGLGRISLPITPAQTRGLIRRCRPAPFGKGTKTLTNPSVRNTAELDPQFFRLSKQWEEAVAETTLKVARELGLPPDRLEAKLYKLLAYQTGGFFLSHRDSEKEDGMVASMVIILPTRFVGGELVVRHGDDEQSIGFWSAAGGGVPSYAAFYADCEHEVEKVLGGLRLCLAYNLVLKPEPEPATARPAPREPLARALALWIADHPGELLVFALEHQYSHRGRLPDLLKGADRAMADLVIPAAESAGCLVHLAQVSRHTTELAYSEDDEYDQWRYEEYDEDDEDDSKVVGERDYHVEEMIEEEFDASDWRDMSGEPKPWGEIPLSTSAVISTIPMSKWKPTSEEYEGYTGNAGNTLDRWYHRSAIVVWSCDQHFDVLVKAGAMANISPFASMVSKLRKTPKKRIEEARADCLRFARAIIAKWPERNYLHGVETDLSCAPFMDSLLDLGERELITGFLRTAAVDDLTLNLKSLVVKACCTFGWDAFSEELKKLIARPSEPRGSDIPFRDIEWLAAFCWDGPDDSARIALARELCSIAVERFCQPSPRAEGYYYGGRQRPSTAEKSLPLLVKAVMSGGLDEDLARLLRLVREHPNRFTLDDGQVPALRELIPWAKKTFGAIHPQLAEWLAAVRGQLEEATESPPEPPGDWARPAEIECSCKECRFVNNFLADPFNSTVKIPAAEHVRGHVTDSISRHKADLKATVLKQGRPYSLVLTKTEGSYERAVNRYEMDLRLLKSLPG